jgi:hypothetical protein
MFEGLNLGKALRRRHTRRRVEMNCEAAIIVPDIRSQVQGI